MFYEEIQMKQEPFLTYSAAFKDSLQYHFSENILENKML